MGLSAYLPAFIPLVKFLQGNWKMPACVNAQLARADAFVMISAADSGTINAIHGDFQRQALEDCVRESVEVVFGEKVCWTVEGSLSIATTSHGTQVLAYSDDGWIGWHADRERLEQWLSAPRAMSPRLAGLVARASHESQAAGVTLSTLDLSGRILGVASLGGMIVIDVDAARAKAPSQGTTAVVLYAWPADAARAAKLIEASAKDPQYPSELRGALAEMRPRVVGAELLLDLGGLFGSSEAIKQATEELAKRVPHDD